MLWQWRHAVRWSRHVLGDVGRAAVMGAVQERGDIQSRFNACTSPVSISVHCNGQDTTSALIACFSSPTEQPFGGAGMA